MAHNWPAAGQEVCKQFCGFSVLNPLRNKIGNLLKGITEKDHLQHKIYEENNDEKWHKGEEGYSKRDKADDNQNKNS